jgi:hypothetical protein
MRFVCGRAWRRLSRAERWTVLADRPITANLIVL